MTIEHAATATSNATALTPGDTPTKNEPVVVHPERESRLEALAAAYDKAKEDAAAAEEHLKAITDAIKLELTSAAPEAQKVDLVSPLLRAPLRLSAKTQWRLDTTKLKAEAPQTYVRYARQSTFWELRALPRRAAS